MRYLLIILSLFILSCESFCDKDECGVCDGPGIETPIFESDWDAGDICDCDGNRWDCLGVCGGSDYVNSCNSDYDCYTEFHDAWCYENGEACEETNCGEGDCGAWNGSQCVADAAIKYDVFLGSTGNLSYSIYSEDPSIPSTFYNDYYYEAIPGTYHFEYYVYWDGSFDEHWEGYYTTYYPINEENICFDLKMYWSSGPTFYDWPPWFYGTPDCRSYFGYTCQDIGYVVECWNGECQNYYSDCDDQEPSPGFGGNRNEFDKEEITLELSDNKLEEYNKVVEKYNKYLNDIEREEFFLNEKGVNIQNSISDITFSKIESPQNNLSIIEIDNHPDVVTQKGDYYILKYIKKTHKK